ncbi:substrate-binding domain-containing protein [Rhizobium leguminosarum]|uniref:substrate-binding domain-containing protein n=1 Tax=Rhizobium leguminosarum TaxID=384 RepID=UPI000684B9B0|nr:substrate-binding domain-containing protein [Rhizobium leguminosarum]
MRNERGTTGILNGYRGLLIASALIASVVPAIAAGQGCEIASKLDPASLNPTGVVGKGPGEPASIDSVKLTEEQAKQAKEKKFRVALVMPGMDIDWSKLQERGIRDTLAKYGAEVVAVADPNWQIDKQNNQIGDLIQLKPDAIIADPLDTTAQSEAYKSIGAAGIKLILMQQVPNGLKYPTDFQAMVSPDNPGNGQVAARMIDPFIPKEGVLGIINYGIDSFVTNERTRGVKEWFAANRPDARIKQADFLDPSKAGDVAANFLTANPDVNGLFVVFDAPAMQVAAALRAQALDVPIATVDLGNAVAMEISKCGLVKGVAGQRPYHQGVTEAEAALQVLLGNEVPAWVVVPSTPVLPQNLDEAYRDVWQAEPPKELTNSCQKNKTCM